MHPWEDYYWLPGVLSEKQIKILIDKGYISGTDLDGVDHSSFDLHLSDEGYEMLQGSMKPFGRHSYDRFLKEKKFANPLKMENGCFHLAKKNCYVFKLKEKLCNLANTNIYGQATAKSTIGRLDVIARLIIDGMYQYETMDPDRLQSSGDMFLEIMPISFNIKVKPDISLSQLRLFYGKLDDSIIKDESFIKEILHGSDDGGGYLSVNITNTRIGGLDVVAFKARKNDTDDEYIQTWEDKVNKDKNKPNPCDFWFFKQADTNERVKIENGEFYIIRSKEKIALPSGIAVYCKAMDESLGEMRIHYAGFVHPNFGKDRKDGQIGTPLIFEVRGHNVDVNLGHGERLAKLIFYRMSEDSPSKDEKDDPYMDQDLNLSKLFDNWPLPLEYEDKEKGQVKAKQNKVR